MLVSLCYPATQYLRRFSYLFKQIIFVIHSLVKRRDGGYKLVSAIELDFIGIHNSSTQAKDFFFKL